MFQIHPILLGHNPAPSLVLFLRHFTLSVLCLHAPGPSGERGGPSPLLQILYFPSLLLCLHSLPFPEHSITLFSIPSGHLSPNSALRRTCLQAFRESFLPSNQGSDCLVWSLNFYSWSQGLWFCFLHESPAPTTALSALPPVVLWLSHFWLFPTLLFMSSNLPNPNCLLRCYLFSKFSQGFSVLPLWRIISSLGFKLSLLSLCCCLVGLRLGFLWCLMSSAGVQAHWE